MLISESLSYIVNVLVLISIYELNVASATRLNVTLDYSFSLGYSRFDLIRKLLNILFEIQLKRKFEIHRDSQSPCLFHQLSHDV